MSNKTYPCILKSKSEHDNRIMLAFNKNECQCINSEAMSNYCGFDFDASENWIDITREYLANTYGKCESQEHADFICKLAEKEGFRTINDYSEKTQWFCFNNYSVDFYSEGGAARHGEKLIHLPLPPKEKPMEETKPIYTKEMDERGELPPVGSEIKYPSGKGVVVINEPDDNGVIVVIENSEGGKSYKRVALSAITPPSSLMYEVARHITDYFNSGNSCYEDLAYELSMEYNITPKGE